VSSQEGKSLEEKEKWSLSNKNPWRQDTTHESLLTFFQGKLEETRGGVPEGEKALVNEPFEGMPHHSFQVPSAGGSRLYKKRIGREKCSQNKKESAGGRGRGPRGVLTKLSGKKISEGEESCSETTFGGQLLNKEKTQKNFRGSFWQQEVISLYQGESKNP